MRNKYGEGDGVALQPEGEVGGGGPNLSEFPRRADAHIVTLNPPPSHPIRSLLPHPPPPQGRCSV